MSWSWDTLGNIGDTAGGLAGSCAAVIAAIAISTTRRDQARRDAAGLHGEMYFQSQRLPPTMTLPDEPGAWSDFEMVCKVRNSSGHPYYNVIASILLTSRRQRVAARGDVVGPATTLYASMGLLDGCDTVPMNEDVQVRLTFIDSHGRAWRRSESGILKRIRMPIRKHKWQIAGRYSRGAALHRLREVRRTRNDAVYGEYDEFVLIDEHGHETELHTLEPSEVQKSADQEAKPQIELTATELIEHLEKQGWADLNPGRKFTKKILQKLIRLAIGH